MGQHMGQHMGPHMGGAGPMMPPPAPPPGMPPPLMVRPPACAKPPPEGGCAAGSAAFDVALRAASSRSHFARSLSCSLSLLSRSLSFLSRSLFSLALARSRHEVPPYDNAVVFSVDVECVAVGAQHHDRAVAQIGLVDCFGRMLLNVLVKPSRPVKSYLTPLTGLTAEKVPPPPHPPRARRRRCCCCCCCCREA
jgi:hypothetical protein